MPQPESIALGLLLAAAIALAAYRVRALTVSGAIAATIVGMVSFAWGGAQGAAALLLFFVTSTALGRWRRDFKEDLGFEKGGRRDAGQVLANGGVAAVCLVLSDCAGGELASPLRLAFLAALAGANADTWGTEIGAAAGGRPYSLRDLKTVLPGTSGAVSLAGTIACLSGAAVIGAVSLMHHLDILSGLRAVAIVTFCGFAGALLDSIAGATLQAQWRSHDGGDRWIEMPTAGAKGRKPDRGLAWIRNDAVNFICTGSAAALAFVLSLL